MKKQLLFLSLFLLCGTTLMAQANKTQNEKKVEVSGSVFDSDHQKAVQSATIQLLALPDTSFATGTVSDEEGKFVLDPVKPGRYLIKISYVGYAPQEKELKLSGAKTVENCGIFLLSTNAVALKEAVVTAKLAQVQVVEDTLVFNSGAFRVPEGSVLEELVKKLPGVTVDDSGTIKVNGKTVSKILVDGKEFFGNDTKMSMKNIPTEMVEKIKAYDKKSDFTRVTGIDDGNEETVLDLQVKEGMKKGWFGNTDLAYGTHDRYSGRLMLNRFSEGQQFSLIGSANNVNDMGFSGGGGGFRGGSRGGGLVASKMGGFNFAIDKDVIELGGNVRFNHSNSDNTSYTSSETFLTTGNNNQYGTSKSVSESRNTNVNGDFRLEWKPDSMTNVIFRPSFSYSFSDNNNFSNSATFNQDPFSNNATYALDDYGNVDNLGFPDSILVNHNTNYSQGSSHSTSLNGNLQLNRKFNNLGRNLTLRGTFSYSDSKSYSLSANSVNYLQSSQSSRSYERNRYSTTPNTNWNYNLQLTYSEPIALATYLQFSYSFQYSYQNSDRGTYIMDSLANFYDKVYQWYSDSRTRAEWASLLGRPLQDYYDKDESRFSMYRNYTQEIQLMFRMIRNKYQFNAGISWLPQHSTMSYDYLNLDTVVSRTVNNFTPTVRFRYRWTKMTSLDIDYRGRTSQPSITDMLDYVDNTNPLSITVGNPGLKPSFNNSFSARFNTYNAERQQGFMANANFSNTLNSVNNRTIYFTSTGARLTMPDNINGNWNVGGGVNFNSPLNSDKTLTFNTYSDVNYSHQVGYTSTNNSTDASDIVSQYKDSTNLYRALVTGSASAKNTMKTLGASERLTFSYRNDWLEVSMNGYLGYNHSRNDQQSSSNLDTYNFSYGPSFNVTLPWGDVRISSDLSMSSRRGYSDATFNTDELLWNAQVSKSFLKGNAATLSFQIYDILGQQSNLSRYISAMSRTDTQYNTIHSYCMLHFIYRLNLFGDKESRARMREAGRMMYNSGGGFGGGRGGGGGGFGGGGGRGM